VARVSWHRCAVPVVPEPVGWEPGRKEAVGLTSNAVHEQSLHFTGTSGNSAWKVAPPPGVSSAATEPAHKRNGGNVEGCGGAERQRKAADGSPRAVSHAGALWVEPWGTRLPGPPSLEGRSIGGIGALLRARAGVGGRPGGPRDTPWTEQEGPHGGFGCVARVIRLLP
jgi:hypothetical protein